MPRFFEDQNGNYYGTITDIETPKGHKAVAQRVPPAPTIEQLRANTSMPRSSFILAAFDAGILSEVDAEQAVNDWPTGWDAFFNGQLTRNRIAAKAEWASVTTVRRDAPLIEQLRIFKGLTEGQIDQLFGIGV